MAFWQNVTDATRRHIQTILDEGLREGWSTQRMARAIENSAPGYSRMRATRVARTEAGRALNSGHDVAINQTAAETGLPIGREWVSILAGSTRPTHAALDGTVIGPGEMFTLGEVQVSYPSHRDLPAGEAVNCFCTVISAVMLDVPQPVAG